MTNRRSSLVGQKGRAGIATVEFAVVAPLLILLFVIAVDFSRIFYYQVTLNQCARNGALYGSALNSYQETSWVTPWAVSVPPSDDNIKTVTIADGASLSPALQTSQVTVGHDMGTDGNTAVQVTISYTFSTLTGFPGIGDYTLTAKSSMRMAQ